MPRGPFEARKGVKSCSLTYSEHIDSLIANFVPIFIAMNFSAKNSITFVGFVFLYIRVKFATEKI